MGRNGGECHLLAVVDPLEHSVERSRQRLGSAPFVEVPEHLFVGAALGGKLAAQLDEIDILALREVPLLNDRQTGARDRRGPFLPAGHFGRAILSCGV